MKRDLTPEQLQQEITVTLPLSVVLSINEQQPIAARTPIARPALPALGADWHGGKYAGLTVEDNDPKELILLPGEFEGPWEKAKAWAAEQGGVLPSRFDQLVFFKHLKGEFKEAWYWSGEPYAVDADYAWYQFFNDGGQHCNHIGDDRARAVRRIAIQ